MSAPDAHETLLELHAQRDALLSCAVAADPVVGPQDDELHGALCDLEELIRHAHDAWVGAAVTEIATLRSQLGSPQYG